MNNVLLRSNKTNIPKINKKLINTKMMDKNIYGYSSCKIKSIIGFINCFSSFFTSSLFKISKHCSIKESLILFIIEMLDFKFFMRLHIKSFLSNSINE